MLKKKIVVRSAMIAGAVVLLVGGVVMIRKKMTGKEVSVYPVSSMAFFDPGDQLAMEGEVTDAAVQKIPLGSGLVDSVKVKTGMKVKKGDCVLKYDQQSVKLAVQADEANLALLKAEREAAVADKERYSSLSPSEDMPQSYEQVIHHTAEPVATLSVIDVGTGPSAGGNAYFCTPETTVTAAMLQNLDDTDAKAEFQMYKDNVLIGTWAVDGARMSSGEKTIYIEKTIIITPDPDPDPTPTPAPDPDPDDPSDNPTEAASVREQTATGNDSPVGGRTEEETRREEKAPYSDWVLGDGVEFFGDGTVSVEYGSRQYGRLISVIPEEAEWDEVVTIDPAVDTSGENYAHSRKELADMIQEKAKEIEEKDLEIKEAELKLKQDKVVSTDGKIRASMDGVVTEVKDPSEVKQGDPLIVIKGNSGFTITAHVSEYDIGSIEKGEKLQVYSYETAANFEAEVTEVSFEPETDHQDGSDVSYYPVTATVTDDSLELNRGEYCQITRMQNEQEDTSQQIVLPLMFIRNDDQGSYCMIADEHDRLKKVYVVTGKTMYGGYCVVREGIIQEDRIAFPYGKNVHEGSPILEKESINDDF